MLYFNLVCEQALPNVYYIPCMLFKTYKKPVCDMCEAGTNCVKCCMCQPRTRGRPRKECESEPSHLIHSAECAAKVHKDSIVAAVTPAKEDGRRVSSLQAHILEVLELMGCSKEHESSVQGLPHIDARCQVLHPSKTDIDAAAMQRIENVYLRAWDRLFLPNLQLKCYNNLKILCSINKAVDCWAGHL